jgi:hypothetical protein
MEDYKEWGFGRAMTYVGYDEREYSKWNEGTGSKLWINREKFNPII